MSNDFKIRLYDHEVKPPAQVWERISESLEEQQDLVKTGSRLLSAEVTPPAAIWDRIASTLQPASFKPGPGKWIPYSRYVAAAAIIGVIALTVSLLLPETPSPVATDLPQAPSQQVPATTPGEQGPGTSQDTEIATEESASSPIASHYRRKGTSYRPAFASAVRQDRSEFPVELSSDFSFDELAGSVDMPSFASGYDPGKAETINHYIHLISPDGYVVRMSAKFADLIGCLYNASFEADNIQCQDQLRQWREKIARSSVAPSPDNFMDILSLARSLQEQ